MSVTILPYRSEERLNPKIYLIENNHSVDTVCLHPLIAEKMKIKEGTGSIKFGTQKNTVKIVINAAGDKTNELLVSSNVVKSLRIPLFCEFDLISDQQNLIIGPFIGIVAARHKKDLNKKLNEFSDYLYHYDQIGGAIMVFSLDQVSTNEQTIQGFMYNPASKSWKRGIYHYPSSLHLRIPWFRSRWQRHFESIMGDTIFNNFHYNKWSIHKLLIDTPEVASHLPEAILYTKPSDVLSFLEKHPSAYLKPIDFSRGKGIMKINQLGMNDLRVKYTKGKKVFQEALNNEDKIKHFLSQQLKPKKYIIQKTIDLISKDTSIIDFRIYLTKDYTGDWKCIEIFHKQGRPGQIVSNLFRGGSFEMGLQPLKETLNLSDHEIEDMKDFINKIALKAVKAVENAGVHFANTAIDIGIDTSKKVWIIEIQHCVPGHKGFEETLYYNYLTTIMQYAKKLAGF
jgi:glutathione synthase/RimK-type ligase-like ATP-grasp enzyme